jgi:dephospho-CoA kinase
MQIWLIAGYAGSGKTTVAEYLMKMLPKAKTTAFAKRVKDDVAEIYSINRQLLETQEGKASLVGEQTVREILIEYSAIMKQLTNNPGIWADYVREEILNEEGEAEEAKEISHWIIHDWRYLAELETMNTLKQSKNATIRTIRVYNPSVQPLNSISEHELDYVITDTVINNTGTLEDLQKNIQLLLDV